MLSSLPRETKLPCCLLAIGGTWSCICVCLCLCVCVYLLLIVCTLIRHMSMPFGLIQWPCVLSFLIFFSPNSGSIDGIWSVQMCPTRLEHYERVITVRSSRVPHFLTVLRHRGTAIRRCLAAQILTAATNPSSFSSVSPFSFLSHLWMDPLNDLSVGECEAQKRGQ